MAIDTENKRRSALNYLWCPILPAPDTTIDAADRAHLCFVYRALTFASGAAATVRTAFARRLWRDRLRRR